MSTQSLSSYFRLENETKVRKTKTQEGSGLQPRFPICIDCNKGTSFDDCIEISDDDLSPIPSQQCLEMDCCCCEVQQPPVGTEYSSEYHTNTFSTNIGEVLPIFGSHFEAAIGEVIESLNKLHKPVIFIEEEPNFLSKAEINVSHDDSCYSKVLEDLFDVVKESKEEEEVTVPKEVEHSDHINDKHLCDINDDMDDLLSSFERSESPHFDSLSNSESITNQPELCVALSNYIPCPFDAGFGMVAHRKSNKAKKMKRILLKK